MSSVIDPLAFDPTRAGIGRWGIIEFIRKHASAAEQSQHNKPVTKWTKAELATVCLDVQQRLRRERGGAPAAVEGKVNEPDAMSSTPAQRRASRRPRAKTVKSRSPSASRSRSPQSHSRAHRHSHKVVRAAIPVEETTPEVIEHSIAAAAKAATTQSLAAFASSSVKRKRPARSGSRSASPPVPEHPREKKVRRSTAALAIRDRPRSPVPRKTKSQGLIDWGALDAAEPQDEHGVPLLVPPKPRVSNKFQTDQIEEARRISGQFAPTETEAVHGMEAEVEAEHDERVGDVSMEDAPTQEYESSFEPEEEEEEQEKQSPALPPTLPVRPEPQHRWSFRATAPALSPSPHPTDETSISESLPSVLTQARADAETARRRAEHDEAERAARLRVAQDEEQRQRFDSIQRQIRQRRDSASAPVGNHAASPSSMHDLAEGVTHDNREAMQQPHAVPSQFVDASASRPSSQASSEPTSPREDSKPMIRTSRWLLPALYVLVLAVGLFSLARYEPFQSWLAPVTVFCPTSEPGSRTIRIQGVNGVHTVHCTPCPHHGYCDDFGHLQCNIGYIRQGDLCKKDTDFMRNAIKLKDRALAVLQEHAGLAECGYSERRGLSGAEIIESEGVVGAFVGWWSSNEADDHDVAINEVRKYSLEALKLLAEDHQQVALYRTQSDDPLSWQYVANHAYRPLSCELRIKAWHHKLELTVVAAIASLLSYLYYRLSTWRWRRRRASELAAVIEARLSSEPDHPFAVDHLRDELWRGCDPLVWARVVEILERDTRIQNTRAAKGQITRECWTWTAEKRKLGVDGQRIPRVSPSTLHVVTGPHATQLPTMAEARLG